MDWSAVAGAAVSGGTSIISNLIANNANKKSQARQNKWVEDMWQREQEYNTPKNQVQRYLEAGINPVAENLDAGLTTAPSSPHAPTMRGPLDGFDLTSSLQSVANLDLIKAQTRYTNSMAGLNEIDAETKGESNRLELERKQKEIDNYVENTHFTHEQAAQLVRQVDNAIRNTDIAENAQKINYGRLRLDQWKINVDKILKERELSIAEKYLALETTLNPLRADLLKNEKDLKAEDADKLRQVIKVLEEQVKLISKDVEWYDIQKLFELGEKGVGMATDIANSIIGGMASHTLKGIKKKMSNMFNQPPYQNNVFPSSSVPNLQ